MFKKFKYAKFLCIEELFDNYTQKKVYFTYFELIGFFRKFSIIIQV